MRPLVYYVAVSLDGFIAAPDGDFSAFLAEGDHMAAILRDYPDALPGPALKALGIEPPRSRFDTVVMGWNTYAVGLPVGMLDPYPHLETVVFSHDPDARMAALPSREAAGRVEFSGDDPASRVRALKAGSSTTGIWLCGGGTLAAALADEIDNLILKVNPLVLGTGIPLFGGGMPPGRFDLTASTAYESGVVISEYAR